MHTPNWIKLAALPVALWLTNGEQCRAREVATPTAEKSRAMDYFRSPEFASPVISPDGKAVAFLARQNGHTRLYQLVLADGKISGIFDPGDGDVEKCWWLGNRRVLLAATGQFGRSFLVQDMDGAKPRLLQPLEHLPLAWIYPITGDENHVIAKKTDQYQAPLLASHPFDDVNITRYVARVDLVRGSAQNICPLEPASSWPSPGLDPFEGGYGEHRGDESDAVFSADGELRAQTVIRNGRWRIMWRANARQGWHEIKGLDSRPTFLPVAVARDNRHLLVIASDQGDTTALMLLDPDTDQRTMVVQRRDRDIGDLIWSPERRFPVGVTFPNYVLEEPFFFEADARSQYAAIRQSLPSTINRITSASSDGTVQIVASYGPANPPRYFLFQREKNRMSLLGQERPDLPEANLGLLQSFTYVTRDGQAESGYLILPRSAEPNRRFPLLVLPLQYVGERALTPDSFNAAEQYMASRGIAVAHFGVRGCAGFGQAFRSAGDFELTGKITEDIVDGVRYLKSHRSVDPRRVGILGVGLGGLFALRATADSTEFESVIALNAPGTLSLTDLPWLTSSPAHIERIEQHFRSPAEAYDLLRQFEPESFTARVSARTLLYYYTWFGAKGSVSAKEAGKVQQAFASHHKPFTEAELDWKEAEHRTTDFYSAKLFERIADFLSKDAN